LSLVLDGVDSTLGSPVDGSGGSLWERDDVLLLLDSLESKKSLVLRIGEGGEHVVSNGEGVVWVRVDLLVLLLLLVEDSKSELVLLGGTVGDSVHRDVLDESLLNWGGDDSGVLAHGRLESHVGGGGAESVHSI